MTMLNAAVASNMGHNVASAYVPIFIENFISGEKFIV